MKKYLLQILIITLFFSFVSCKKYEERGKDNVKISGYLIDKCSWQPIENVKIVLFKAGEVDDSIPSICAFSDKNGYYEISFRAKKAYSNTNYNKDYDLRFTCSDYFMYVLPLCIIDPSINENEYIDDSTKAILQYESELDTNLILSRNTILTLTFQGILDGEFELEDYMNEFSTANAYYSAYSEYYYPVQSIKSDTTFTFTVKACDSVRINYGISNPIAFDSTVYIYCPLGSNTKDTISL